MTTLLQALLRNESGGRNIPNVHQGTSSGQAQGYFQITTGTWNEFGGNRYAPDPLHATYEQQAEVASRIPLKRWDPSTVALMRATGRPVDPNRTLGENLAMSGESFANSGVSSPGRRHVGGAGSGPGYFADTPALAADSSLDNSGPAMFPVPPTRDASLADMFASTVSGRGGGGGGGQDLSQTGGLVGDDTGGALPTLDYASAKPQAAPAAAAPDLSPLAQLFQLKNIGQAPAIQQAAPFRGF
jgi:hypothetical protein